jgi:hypothetical protein
VVFNIKYPGEIFGEIALLDGGHDTQVRPQRCLGDRLSIVVIVLLPFTKGLV